MFSPTRVVLPLACIWIALAALVAPPAAQAHDTDPNPHVWPAVYLKAANLDLDPQGLGAGWHVDEVRQGFNANVGNIPQLRIRECENTAAPCIHIREVNRPETAWHTHWDATTCGTDPKCGTILFNMAQISPRPGAPDQGGRDRSYMCKALYAIMGGHLHTAGGNCGRIPHDVFNDHLSDNAAIDMTLAYGIVG